MARPISIRSGEVEFLKLNAESLEWRDTYQWMLGLSWPRFSLFIAGIYVVLNLVFAALYCLGHNCVADLPPGSFVDAFFFSVQTLATVGYGHWYPQTIYGHVISTIEIVVGMFGLAVITGLIFVRFSRPVARIVFSKFVLIGPLNGQPTLMVRIGNLRQQSMVEAEFRIMFARDELIAEGETFRYFYELKLHFHRIAAFPAALTLRHHIDQSSPLYGATPESLQACRAIFVVSLVGIDPVIPASVQTHRDYTWRDVRFDYRFTDIYTEKESGKLTIDFARIDEIEPARIPTEMPNA